MKTETISVKKLKKDGTIDRSLMAAVAAVLADESLVMMPIDSIYGYGTVMGSRSFAAMLKLTGKEERDAARVISSFKMLDEIAAIGKMEFDFLHRIWPGELVVYVPAIANPSVSIPVRMPRSRYLQEIIDAAERPVGYLPLLDRDNNQVYTKKELLRAAEGRCDCALIIEEFCKEHVLPTVVDISGGALNIINEGRVSADEVKSLYFLGKDDTGM